MGEQVEIARLSSRGQVVIPKRVRERLRLEEGDLLLVTVVGDAVVMKRLDRRELLREFDEIRRSVRERLSVEEVERIVHEARESTNGGH